MSPFLKGPVAPSKFKNTNGVLLTKGLFFEMVPGQDSPIYTLKDEDHTFNGKEYLSLYRLYMEEDDPTEYIFAKKHMDSWQHWEALCRSPWFKDYLTRWRHELELRLKAEALQRIKAESKSGSKNAFAANRFILEKGYAKESTRGRPSKDEISRRATELAQDEGYLEEDFSRVITITNPKTNAEIKH